MPDILNKLFLPRTAFWLCLLVSVMALVAAFTAQLGFGMKPCILCLWQRLPYALLLFSSLAALVLRVHKPKNTLVFLVLFGLLFISSFALAFFHVGVEEHWWALSGGCPVEPMGEKTQEQLLAELLTTPTSSCDKVAWRLFGFSITVYNAALSLGMAAYLVIVGYKAQGARA